MSDIFTDSAMYSSDDLLLFSFPRNFSASVHEINFFYKMFVAAEKFPFNCAIGVWLGWPEDRECPGNGLGGIKFAQMLIAEAANYSIPVSAAIYRESDIASTDLNHIDSIRIQNYSFLDWPLLEEIALTGKPVIASTDGIPPYDIDRVAAFFSNRNIRLTLMRKLSADFQDNDQIRFMRKQYGHAIIGCTLFLSEFSPHLIQRAAESGTTCFEFVLDRNMFDDPDRLLNLVKCCLGLVNVPDSWYGTLASSSLQDSTTSRLHLHKRGVFARHDIKYGEILSEENIFFEKSTCNNQLLAEEWSKYSSYSACCAIPSMKAVFRNEVIPREFICAAKAQLPDHYSVEENLFGGVPCITISNKLTEHAGTIVFVHGGGYVSGSARESLNVAKHLAISSSCDVVSVDYRLAPAHHFPAPVDDLLHVYGAITDAGVSNTRIGFYGESAGAGLVLAFVMKLIQTGEKLPAAIACSSPWADLTNSGKGHSERMNRLDIRLKTKILNQNAEMYADGESLLNPLLSPVYGSFEGFPPLLLFAGTNEILLEDARRVAAAAGESGVDVQLRIFNNMPHVFTSFIGRIEEANQALAESADFFHNHFC